MWFSSVYLKSVRDARIAILGWGVGMGLLVLFVFAAVPSVLATPASRASLVSLAGAFAWLAEPVRVDTPGGYATFKYGVTILALTVWPILTGARMLRREETRGSMDALLSLPRTRMRVAVEKVAAMWTALLGMGVLIAALTFAGGVIAKTDLTVGQASLFAFNIVLVGFLGGALAMLLAQFTRESGTAAGIAAAIFLVMVVVDMVHRVIPGTAWFSQVSPVFWYNVNKPLVPGQVFYPLPMLALLALALVLTALAIGLFLRRDIAGTVPLPAYLTLPERAPSARPSAWARWSVSSLYARGIATLAWPTFWWTLVIAGFGGWMVVIAIQVRKSLEELFQSSPLMMAVLRAGGGSAVNLTTILSSLFIFLPILLMAFAVTQANRWSADEEDGRLELVLATPQPRLTVLLSRFAALTTATVFIALASLAVIASVAASQGASLDGRNLVAATLSMVPLGLIVAALGYLLAGWLSAAVDTGLLSLVLVAWFFIDYVGPDLKMPSGLERLSAFYYYGTPLLNGLPVADTIGLVAAVVLVLGLASLRFVRKDIMV